MANDPDPYRTLGLPRGASLDEVKRAYRRLAKEHHPDAAGNSDLKRFLAIQTAYDQLAGPGATGRGGAARRPGPARRPWDADRDRADATHRAYAGRERRNRTPGARRPGSRPPGAGPADGERGSATGTGGPSSGRGVGGTGPGPGTSGGARGTRAARPPKKATLGSTSYDGADDQPFEPDWAGAAWYGTTSGTYWTLNPREYADPRKHGPEYQARARRAAPDGPAGATGAGSGEVPGAEQDGGRMPSEGGPEVREASSSGSAGAPPATSTHSTSSWWDATAADPVPPDPGAGAAARDAGWGDSTPRGRAPQDDEDGPLLPGSPWDAARWLEAGPGGLVGRIGLAVVGWAPIALGIGWLAGEITGCGRFAADCDAGAAPFAWFVQVALLAVLLLVPRLAMVTTIATIGTLAVAVPGAVLLSATGGATQVATGRTVLSGLLLVGWVVGLALGVARLAGRLRAPGP